MTDKPDSTSANTDAGSQNTAANQPANSSRAFTPRPSLGRGFGAYTHPQAVYPAARARYSPVPATRKKHPLSPGSADATAPLSEAGNPSVGKVQNNPLAWLMPWRSQQQPALPLPVSTANSSADSGANSSPEAVDPRHHPSYDNASAKRFPVSGAPPSNASSQAYSARSQAISQASSAQAPQLYSLPEDAEMLVEGSPHWSEGASDREPLQGSPVPSLPPRFWARQPYIFLAYFLLVSGAITTAWLFGILTAQLLPGRFSNPPLQESLLRKSSRLTHQLWHFPQLWKSPTAQVRIDAVPLPETGPIAQPITLSPIERQPLIDELNAVETEILTLDRRLQSLEKQLGKPPYQGMGIENRINTMRTAIEAPVRSPVALPPPYEPLAYDSDEALLDVAKLEITLPSDALFAPGDPNLKEAALLERVLDRLVGYPDATISVRVHSDDQVSAIASREYTLAQANTLARHLQRNLPTPHRWITVGMGAAQPVTDNVDAIERQQNRRVEILVDTR